MKIFEALNQMRSRLPLERTGRSFIETLQSEFSEYILLLKEIDEDDFIALFTNEGATKNKDLTKRKFISFVKRMHDTINSIVSIYYNGYPSDAYLLLEDLLKGKKFTPKKKGARCASPGFYIDDILENYFLLRFQNEFANLYRMRISNNSLSKEGLFHVPFELREWVATARFSIPGFPCLYFGTSLNVCWNEIKRDLENGENAYACRYQNCKPIAFVNLTIPDVFPDNIVDTDSHFVFRFLVTYPFYLSCLVKVNETKHSFKPEYVLPQLLLQYVKKQDMLNGIIYSSTKDKNLVGEKYNNIVIPARKIAAIGYCENAKEWYCSTMPIVVDLNNIDVSENELNNQPTTKIT